VFQVSDAAAAQIAEVLLNSEAPDDVVIRLGWVGEGVTICLDEARPDDEMFAHEGRTVLVVDRQVSESLSDKKLDIEHSGDGAQLTLV